MRLISMYNEPVMKFEKVGEEFTYGEKGEKNEE